MHLFLFSIVSLPALFTPQYDKLFLSGEERSVHAAETVIYGHGRSFLQTVIEEYPHLLPYFDTFRKIDLFRDTSFFNYGTYGYFSPQTLRDIKITGDILYQFGDLSNKRIVEIGSGHGASLSYFLHELFPQAHYTIVDTTEAIETSQREMHLLGITDFSFHSFDELSSLGEVDIVISQFGVSFDNPLLEELLLNTPSGFIAHWKCEGLTNLVKNLYYAHKQGLLTRELPNTHPDNLHLIWKPSSLRFSRKCSPSPLRDDFLSVEYSGGRLGDNLMSYLHARWLSYKYDIPLSFKPFPYSEAFSLDNAPPPPSTSPAIRISNERHLFDKEPGTHFIVPYFPDSIFEWECDTYACWFKIDWADPEFKQIVHACLTPKEAITTIEIPKEHLSVALHVRRGGGFDPANFQDYPALALKMPADDWYIEQLAFLASLFPDQKLWVFLFTDDLSPQTIAKRYEEALGNPNVEIVCRPESNPFSNVLEDFFSMTLFDCIIHPESNMSLVASKLGNYKVCICPRHASKYGTHFKIDSTEIHFKG